MSTEIAFNESASKAILEQFDKTVDDSGYVVEEDTGNRVLTPDGEELPLKQFAGIAKGSEIFIEDNFVSLINHVNRRTSDE